MRVSAGIGVLMFRFLFCFVSLLYVESCFSFQDLEVCFCAGSA